MTTAESSTTYINDYTEAARQLHAERAPLDPAWLTDLRASALESFSAIGLPTHRRGNEEWKYTDIRPIVRGAYMPRHNPPAGTDDLRRELDRLPLGASEWTRLTFVDDHFRADLSDLTELQNGVMVSDLATAITERPGLVQPHLGRLAEHRDQGFTALNTALLDGGAFVYLPPESNAGRPIHLLFFTTARSNGTVAAPRVLIVAEPNSRSVIVESHVSAPEADHFTSAVAEIVVGQGAVVDYCKIQHESEAAFDVLATQVELNRDASFTSVAIDVGGRLTRNNLNVVMAGEGSRAEILGAYVITRNQHVDNQVIVDHVVGHNSANEIYKGILDGRARSVFHGSIIVRPNAAKVFANQVDKNLLLSNDAEADTKPAFWIYCDDVRCGHGAACGELDEDALFYLASRGVPEEEARMMLIRAYVAEIVDKIREPSIQQHVAALIADKLDNL